MFGLLMGNNDILELEDTAAFIHAWGLWVDIDLLSKGLDSVLENWLDRLHIKSGKLL
jgi:hypothetical protein